MTVSKKVKALLVLNGRKQADLAEYFGVSPQSMNNKMARGSWSAKDLMKVCKFTGCKLAFVLPDGNKILIEDEETPDA